MSSKPKISNQNKHKTERDQLRHFEGETEDFLKRIEDLEKNKSTARDHYQLDAFKDLNEKPQKKISKSRIKKEGYQLDIFRDSKEKPLKKINDKSLDKLSLKTKNSLIFNGLSSIDDVISFLDNGGDLNSLKKCGKKAISEILELTSQKKLNINDFSSFSSLSERAKRVCKNQGFNNAEDIQSFIRAGGILRTLKKCGFKVEQELLAFVEKSYKYRNWYNKYFKIIFEKDVKKDEFIKRADLYFEDLTISTKNLILEISSSEISKHEEFIRATIVGFFDLDTIKNTIEINTHELQNYQMRIKDLLLEIGISS